MHSNAFYDKSQGPLMPFLINNNSPAPPDVLSGDGWDKVFGVVMGPVFLSIKAL